ASDPSFSRRLMSRHLLYEGRSPQPRPRGGPGAPETPCRPHAGRHGRLVPVTSGAATVEPEQILHLCGTRGARAPGHLDVHGALSRHAGLNQHHKLSKTSRSRSRRVESPSAAYTYPTSRAVPAIRAPVGARGIST